MQATGIRGPPTRSPRSWLAWGNLNNGANDGLSYVNANNGLTNANWNIGSRHSVVNHGACGPEPVTSTPRAERRDGACPLNAAK